MVPVKVEPEHAPLRDQVIDPKPPELVVLFLKDHGCNTKGPADCFEHEVVTIAAILGHLPKVGGSELRWMTCCEWTPVMVGVGSRGALSCVSVRPGTYYPHICPGGLGVEEGALWQLVACTPPPRR